MSTHSPTKAVTETDDLEQGSLGKESPNPILHRERHGERVPNASYLPEEFVEVLVAHRGSGAFGSGTAPVRYPRPEMVLDTQAPPPPHPPHLPRRDFVHDLRAHHYW